MTRPRLTRRHWLWVVWTAPSLVFLLATLSVYSAFRISPPTRLDAGARTAVTVSLRAALENSAAVPCTVHGGTGSIAVTVWLGGRSRARVDVMADSLAQAVDQVALALPKQQGIAAMAVADRHAARIQVDIITGHAPLGGGQWVFDSLSIPGIGDMLAISSGVEGVGVAATPGKPTWVLPHELVAAKVLASKRPSQTMQDFAVGIDKKRITTLLAQRAGVPSVDAAQMFRFRTDTFVEAPRPPAPALTTVTPPLPLYRGIPAPPPISGAVLRAAALAGGSYLVAHMAPNGRYIYEHDLATGGQTNPKSNSYSMPRHAGTTYFLAELYRITKDPTLREPIERAFAHLAELMANGKCATTLPDGTQIDCVMDRHETKAQLGSTALAVVALAEYQRATGDTRYLPVATKLAAFILWMQRSDGSFRHTYTPANKQANQTEMQLYYSGEASLALARMFVVTQDPKYAAAAEHGLDWLMAQYDFFMGGFFYGEEHWTCIAAEALWPTVKTEKYEQFCTGYSKFLRDQQASFSDAHPDQNDFAGAYVFTPFLVPNNTPAGSRTEAMISAYLLTKDHGHPDPEIRQQIRGALQYALGQQIRAENDFAVVGAGDGGMPGTPIDRTVRIDYVQHVCSAFIRASEWIDAL